MNAIVNLNADNFDVANYAIVTASYRSATVTEENKRTDWSRETLFGLISGAMTEGDLLATLLHVYKPKKANGKAGDTFSSLRNAKGGDAARKAAETCLDLAEAAEKGNVADTFRPVLIAFVTDAPDAPKSLKALKDALATMRKEATAAAAGEDAGEGDGEGEDAGEEAPATPLAVMAARMALAIREASPEALIEAEAALSDLRDAISAATATVATVEEAIAA